MMYRMWMDNTLSSYSGSMNEIGTCWCWRTTKRRRRTLKTNQICQVLWSEIEWMKQIKFLLMTNLLFSVLPPRHSCSLHLGNDPKNSFAFAACHQPVWSRLVNEWFVVVCLLTLKLMINFPLVNVLKIKINISLCLANVKHVTYCTHMMICHAEEWH